MAIKTMAAASGGGGQWSEGWHVLTITSAEYGTWDDTKILDVRFEGYPENFNHRIYEKFNDETKEEFGLSNFFKTCNAGLMDKIKSSNGKEVIQYDDEASGLIGKQFNALFYKDASGYNKICPKIAPVEQRGEVVSYSAEDVDFWKGVAKKYQAKRAEAATPTETVASEVSKEDIPF